MLLLSTPLAIEHSNSELLGVRTKMATTRGVLPVASSLLPRRRTESTILKLHSFSHSSFPLISLVPQKSLFLSSLARRCVLISCLPSTTENEPVDPTKLFVSGLSFHTTEENLRNAFQNFGQLVHVKLVMDRISNRPRGYAFLSYSNKEESMKAIEGMHGKVPQGLETKIKDNPQNKGGIYIWTTSRPHVVKLYQLQFQIDFSLFLDSRCDELVPGGLVVLAFLGRKKDILTGELSCQMKLLVDALNDMVLEGLVEEEKLDSFNLAVYAPSMEEAETVINAQNRFEILRIEMFEPNWDPFDDSNDDTVHDSKQSGINVSNYIRAVLEPIITTHFGESILDELFLRFANNAANHLLKEKTKLPVLVLVLKKK